MPSSAPQVRTELVPFRPAEHLPLLARFSEQVWDRPREPGYLRWRYLEHPDHLALLALRSDECLAMVSVFRRPYRVGDREILVCDAFDWFTLPAMRRSGMGVRLLQRLMQGDEPVVVTGGSPDTRDLLPRMGFQVPALVERFGLLLGAERAGEALARRTRMPRSLGRLLFRAAAPVLAPRRHEVPRGATVEVPATLTADDLAIDPRPGGQGSAPLWRPELVAWLAAGTPGFGRYEALRFRIDGGVAGWALLRLFEGPNGREAALLDVRARAPDPDRYTWLASECAVYAARAGAGLLTAGSSCPHVQAALQRLRFRSLGSAPIHYYARSGAPLEAPVVFGAHWGDEPLVPYPSGAWPSD